MRNRQYVPFDFMCMFSLFTLCARAVVNRWLDSGHDDGLIEREIDVVHYVQTPPPQQPLPDEPGYVTDIELESMMAAMLRHLWPLFQALAILDHLLFHQPYCKTPSAAECSFLFGWNFRQWPFNSSILPLRHIPLRKYLNKTVNWFFLQMHVLVCQF